jgi:hypothetical protein
MEGILIESLVRKAVTEYRRQEREHAEEAGRESSDASGCWVCPICRNWFALDDGTRVCTHDKSGTCKCPDMPAHLRRIRDLNLLRRAVVLGNSCEKEKVECLESLARIQGALHGER